ncbi:MAG: PASTA domain-containing protein [Candidatus Cloacimonetes bacterium]|jgi:serine/threonine-protein kinase|nr:PASTA domain-containing protein [Candidatus Cloacimonadota bacterium]NLO43436.1 PASTA domain-containing protein [Candidatus Cloacimonadota bacterium]
MSKNTTQKWLYTIGIGIGVIFITAFLFSKVVLPIVFGRPDIIATPEVVGKELMTAKRILQESKLHVVVRDSLFSESFKEHTVLEQSPLPETKIRADGTVYLTVSKGSRLVAVPNVLEMNYQEAMISLRNNDLRSAIVDSVYSNSVERDAVIRSNPYPNSKVERKTIVRLTLSRGEEPLPDSLEVENQSSGGWRSLFNW